MILQKVLFLKWLPQETFWMEEVFDFSLGKQNMGARNFVRKALLDKKPPLY